MFQVRRLMEMRIIDFGSVSAIRSQSLWHAIAYGVSCGAPPTLSFMTPRSPYVSIGYHSNIEAVDLEACAKASLPVFRRMVGGGPVYLDEDQLFFQITLPLAMTPSVRAQAVRSMLSPAVDAFRAVGVDAELDDVNEIVMGDRKICGHAAGQIERAVIVVGNLITGFDHDTAASIAHTPNQLSADLFRRMLARYVTAVPADPEAFVVAAVDSYGSAYGLDPQAGGLNEVESARLDELDLQLNDRAFVKGEKRPVSRPWRVKVKSGVWVAGHSVGSTSAAVGVVDGVVTAAEWSDGGSYERMPDENIIGRSIRTGTGDLKREGKVGALFGQLVDAVA